MNLLINGRLNSYLADINQQAEDMFFRLVEQMAEREGVTEQLKANNQMKWGARMKYHTKQSNRNRESRYNLQLT